MCFGFGAPMLASAHILFGAALGVSSNVFVLSLATIASITLDVWLGVVAGDAFTTIIVATGLNVIALQVAYFVCGVAVSILSKRLYDRSPAVTRAVGHRPPISHFAGRSTRNSRTYRRKTRNGAIN